MSTFSDGLDPISTPAALHLRQGNSETLYLTAYHFGLGVTAPFAYPCLRRLRWFTYVGLTVPS
ncbi:hypothetical protein QUF64_11965 [Anaerolineales bacterium HSG6]|nr:hypothetical protein [Anaerolineales bacterium HSG6]